MIKQEIVNKLKSINELKLLTVIANVNLWPHTSYTRPLVAEYLNIAEITVKKILGNLVAHGLVNKLSKGLYQINKDIIDGATTKQ